LRGESVLIGGEPLQIECDVVENEGRVDQP
jgi:hypothetical protein